MARKAKKGKYTLFPSLGIYTHPHTHGLYGRTENTLHTQNFFLARISNKKNVFFHPFWWKETWNPKAYSVYAHLGYAFCCFGQVHGFVIVLKRRKKKWCPSCLWDKGVLWSPLSFPASLVGHLAVAFTPVSLSCDDWSFPWQLNPSLAPCLLFQSSIWGALMKFFDDLGPQSSQWQGLWYGKSN